MATLTTITIVNKALLLCGASPITALTDDTVNARSVNAVYEIARKSMLCECRWSFATTRSTLATASTSTIAWLYDDEGYAYSRPSNALRIFSLSDPYAAWREECDLIISDTGSMGVVYVFDHEEVGKWPTEFVSAFIDKLCSDISFHILNDAKKAQLYLEKYEKISLPKAMSANSQKGRQQIVIDDEWTGAKYANGGSADPSRSYS